MGNDSNIDKDIILGSDFNYIIDTSYGLSNDGYIATGTESIVYKGLKTSKDGKIILSCVLKFKYKSIKVGTEKDKFKVVNILDKFKKHDLKIFDELQDCRSVVRIFDIIEDLGSFSVTDTHVPDGKKSISINKDEFFCVVEEYIDGWSLEEYCRDEYWKLTETVDVGNNLKQKISFHKFSDERKRAMVNSYHHDYDEVIRYQSEMFHFMLNLCEILHYITDIKKILHLDLKPDNIMVTRYGKEIVLIDFGRSEYIDPETNCVMSTLGEADYNTEQKLARMFQYGTLGYAALECYAPAMEGSRFPFEKEGINIGRMTVESDIFSFGATFWECLNIFELYTGSKEFAMDKSLGGSYDFYKNHMMNDSAYFDRDLSLTSSHYHQKLEEIIKKCTRKRSADFLTSPLYFHTYEELKEAIIYARDSAPALVKTENIQVRNSFGLVGVMAGLLGTVLVVCFLLKMSGSYFAERKIENIITNYNPTKIELLESAALEQMKSSNEDEKHSTYKEICDFLQTEDEDLEYSETVVLVELLKKIESSEYIADAVDNMLLQVNSKGISNCIKYIVTNITDCDSIGYTLAVQIYNAQNRTELVHCYEVLMEYSENEQFNKLVQRLAQDLNHDELIMQIAQSKLEADTNYNKYSTNERQIKLAEYKNEVKDVLDKINVR